MTTTNKNTGDRNTGNCNTGNYNTGCRNTGEHNTGHWNSGDRNTGEHNTGHWNSGQHNSGHCNSGHRNTGKHNTGQHNSGHWNTGYCNSITPEYCLIFNKPAKRSDWFNTTKPSWMHVSLTKWIAENDMTNKEKEAYPSYVSTGGYLRAYQSLKHAYIESWENASEEDRMLTRQLPNFDEQVFAEVFGFNPWKQKIESIEIGGKTYQVTDELKSALKNLKEIN